MLKITCCFLPLLALAIAAPVGDDETGVSSTTPIVNILESDAERQDDGSYSFSYRAEDGTFRSESAVVVNAGKKDQFLQITGSYSYLDAEGKEVVVTYKADNHGFVPEGTNIEPEIVTSVKQTSVLGPYNPEADRKDRALEVPAKVDEEVVSMVTTMLPVEEPMTVETVQ